MSEPASAKIICAVPCQLCFAHPRPRLFGDLLNERQPLALLVDILLNFIEAVVEAVEFGLDAVQLLLDIFDAAAQLTDFAAEARFKAINAVVKSSLVARLGLFEVIDALVDLVKTS